MSFLTSIPSPSDSRCVFWHDFEELTSDNKWKDKSRNSLHASPQSGFIAPNYGLYRTPKGKGYANFTGAANVYATLPLDFYANAPAREFTIVSFYKNTSGNRLFSCWNNGGGGVNYGFIFDYWVGGNRHYIYQGQGGATLPQWNTNALSPTRNSSVAIVSTTTSPQIWFDGNAISGQSWAVGSFGTCSYDSTQIPAIGSSVGGGSYFIGRMYFLALFKDWIPNNNEAKAISSYWRDNA